jgi:N-acetylmuramoyl-L-alanine amidase
VALYGVETSSTWITHRTGLKVVDEVTWQQPLPTTYEVLIHLKTPHIWGYRLNRSGSMLTLKVKHPPAVTRTADSLDVSGLKVALEAGHGGSNWGAVGLSGLKEKTINLDVAQRLEVLCTAAGMEVLQIRPDDRNMSLTEKRNAARDWDADICVSIHANATGSRGGYLRVEGTSTYYHNPFWKPFARNVYQRLLELPLEEFGTVGSFNYKVIRQSEQPTILVEQAFMSHAEDEEKLFSDRFRQELAEKVFAGMLDTIGEMVPEPESNEE